MSLLPSMLSCEPVHLTARPAAQRLPQLTRLTLLLVMTTLSPVKSGDA